MVAVPEFKAAFEVRCNRFFGDMADALEKWREEHHGLRAEAEAAGCTLERLARTLVGEVGLASPYLPATLRASVELPCYAVSLELRFIPSARLESPRVTDPPLSPP